MDINHIVPLEEKTYNISFKVPSTSKFLVCYVILFHAMNFFEKKFDLDKKRFFFMIK